MNVDEFPFVRRRSAIQGRIVRKKKRSQWIVLTVQSSTDESEADGNDCDDEDGAVSVYLHRTMPYHPATIFVHAIVRVSGEWMNSLNDNNNRSVGDDDDGSSDSHEHLNEKLYFVASSSTGVELLQCAPDPHVIVTVVEGIVRREFTVCTLLPYYCYGKLEGDVHEKHEAELRMWTIIDQMMMHKHDRKKIAAVTSAIVRCLLQGRLDVKHEPRQRTPHTKQRDLRVLSVMEKRVPLFKPITSSKIIYNSDSAEEDKSSMLPVHAIVPHSFDAKKNSERLPLNVPVSSDDETILMSARGKQSRKDYLLDKKHPQVEWMVQRIRQIIQERSTSTTTSIQHIVDVGGGRGDLAVTLAVQFASVALVTVVDKNVASLAAGRDYAAVSGAAADRMNFVRADFVDFCRNQQQQQQLPQVDLVVALHACGDLSDAALSYATECGCSFVICPCCYTKRYSLVRNFVPPYMQQQAQWCTPIPVTNEDMSAPVDDTVVEESSPVTVVCRLAELNERPDVNRRAMIVVNSARLCCAAVGGSYHQVQLEEYCSTYSRRNLVLVGIARQL